MDNEQGKRWLWFEKLTQITCQYFESEGIEAELVTATQLPKKNQLLIIMIIITQYVLVLIKKALSLQYPTYHQQE